MPCLYVLLCGPKIRNKDFCILYLVYQSLNFGYQQKLSLSQKKKKRQQLPNSYLLLILNSNKFMFVYIIILQGCRRSKNKSKMFESAKVMIGQRYSALMGLDVNCQDIEGKFPKFVDCCSVECMFANPQ